MVKRQDQVSILANGSQCYLVVWGVRRNWRAYMALVAVYFFWGTTYLGIRMALEAMPAGLLIGVRFFLLGQHSPDCAPVLWLPASLRT